MSFDGSGGSVVLNRRTRNTTVFDHGRAMSLRTFVFDRQSIVNYGGEWAVRSIGLTGEIFLRSRRWLIRVPIQKEDRKNGGCAGRRDR